MHSVVETPAFQRSAADAGMTGDEITQLIDYLAANPESGDEIRGTGGCRKQRNALRISTKEIVEAYADRKPVRRVK
jgi:hypothetical protein